MLELKRTLLFVFLTSAMYAISQPASNIWLLQFENNKLEFYKKITRDTGYDNQPKFHDRKLYFTSSLFEQTDIFYYDLNDGKVHQFTDTRENEYSPTPTTDGKNITVVRVGNDGKQLLWNFPVEGGEPSLIFPNIEPVGYFAWIDNQTIAMFVLGDPVTLQIGELKSGNSTQIDQNIGRSLHPALHFKKLKSSFYFSKELKGIQQVYLYRGEKSKRLTELPRGTVDFCVSPSGNIISSDGSIIKRYNLQNEQWEDLIDLELMDVNKITRLAISNNGEYLAIVVQ